MTQYTFDFITPLSIQESLAALHNMQYSYGELMKRTTTPKVSVIDDMQPVYSQLEIAVLKAIIHVRVERTADNQTHVVGQLVYASKHRQRDWLRILAVFILGTILVMVGISISNALAGTCGSLLIFVALMAAIVNVLGFTNWLDEHEYELIRMIKQHLLAPQPTPKYDGLFG